MKKAEDKYKSNGALQKSKNDLKEYQAKLILAAIEKERLDAEVAADQEKARVLNDLLEEKREAKKIAETTNDRLKLETKSAAELLKNQMERQLARDKGEAITDLREK